MPEATVNESYIRIDGDVKRGIILLADHARNALPARYGTLGLDPKQFSRHIAYDIGVEAVATGLARALQCPALQLHGTRTGLGHALIVIRQDLIAHQTGVDEWIDRLARVLEPILNEPRLHRILPERGLP